MGIITAGWRGRSALAEAPGCFIVRGLLFESAPATHRYIWGLHYAPTPATLEVILSPQSMTAHSGMSIHGQLSRSDSVGCLVRT